jgi:chromosome partitioning protein
MGIDYHHLSRVVSVATGKGGVLKTSIAANVAGVSARAGFRTLLVELDPQSDLGDDLGYYGDHDDGEQLTRAILTGEPLVPSKVDVRDGLDVVTGGEFLNDAAAALSSRAQRRGGVTDMLAKPLAPLASKYDLVLIDTPPVAETLQLLALGAARWLLIPTKFDASSIKAMRSIAARVDDARSAEHQLDILAVVLAGVSASATRVREGAESNIKSMLTEMDEDLLLPQMIRESAATARACRDRGLLAYEIAEEVEGAEPYWAALRSGKPIKRLPGSAPALSDDYIRLTDQLIRRLAQREESQEALA